jgi:Domain of unknown function (DUF4845)
MAVFAERIISDYGETGMKITTQSGFTIWSILAIVLLIGFFSLLGIKLFPVYMVDMNVKSSLTSLKNQPGAADMTNLQLKTALDKRFQINDVDRSVNTREALSFESDKGARIVRVSYESVTPIFKNIYVLIVFDHAEEIGKFAPQ